MAAGLKADPHSRSILDRLSQTVAAWPAYEVDFTVLADDLGSVQGTCLVSGDSYRIRVMDRVQFSDGKARYEVSDADREVVIDRVDLESRSILANPTRAFSFGDELFSHRYMGTQTLAGTDYDRVELEPLEKTLSTGQIQLYTDPVTGLPFLLRYAFDGQQVEVRIDRMRKVPAPASGTFAFRASDFPGYEIIDFR